MGTYENILYEKKRKGVLITFNRPEQMNALNQGLRTDIHMALDEAEKDPEIRYIILTGAGRAYSAGERRGCWWQRNYRLAVRP